jgi:hypothetical protein
MPRHGMRCMFTTKLPRTNNQSLCEAAFAIVHSRCRKFLKHVHNLFTRRSGLLSPAGLRLEIGRESDKKKMHFIFNYDKKIFLTGKRSARVDLKTETVCRKNFRASQTATIPNLRGHQTVVPTPRASRVDQIGLCAQFPASVSGGQTLSKL